MFSLPIYTIATALSILVSYIQVQNLLENVAKARSSGFHYIIVPFSPLFIPWVLVQPLVLPLLDRLPLSWTQPWLSFIVFKNGWHNGYVPFRDAGVDSLMIVSPGSCILMTSDPDVAHQIFQNNAFGKPQNLMSILNVFGPTLTGTDGPEARLYRKLTAPFFNQDTMDQVWRVSLDSARVLAGVIEESHEQLRPILARLTLHILNTICFESEQDCLDELQDRAHITPGHNLSVSQAMSAALKFLPTIFSTPAVILNYSPLPVHRMAHQAYNELRKHIEELRVGKTSKVKSKSSIVRSSLLDLIVRSRKGSTGSSDVLPTPAEIGNIFIFMFAGHEANANTLHFIILLLACHPNYQAALQSDIDRITRAVPQDQWSLEAHYPLLYNSHVGAVINETSRLFTVLPYLPKISPPRLEVLDLGDKRHILPAKTMVLINTSAIHRHPTVWPHTFEESPLAMDTAPNPVASFNPDHWLNHTPIDMVKEAPADLLNPRPGSYIPFSDGNRGCLGKRFALVELLALITSLFSEYSVELAIDCPMDASEQDRRTKWQDARQNAEREMSAGVKFTVSLRMTGDVAVRFVKRRKASAV